VRTAALFSDRNLLGHGEGIVYFDAQVSRLIRPSLDTNVIVDERYLDMLLTERFDSLPRPLLGLVGIVHFRSH
jgi:hypothetical protein